MTTQELDQAKLEAFGGQLISLYTGAGLSLLISVGQQAGLFEAMATLPPSTSDRIAEASGLQERYVREWLAAMACGRIVAYDPVARTYRLPPEHAAMLTGTGPNNFGAFMPAVAQFAAVEEQLVECFRHGGGVPYTAYPKFQRLMASFSGAVHDTALIPVILPLVPGLTDRLAAGVAAADVACGMGHAVNLMAKAFPNSRFAGYDFSEEGIAAGRAEAETWGLTNARFEVADIAALDLADAFDLVTVFDAIHDQAQPERVLRVIHRALRPGGTFLMVDVAASSNLEENLDHPMGAAGYFASTFHCMTVSLAQGGAGLGTMWGEQTARQMLAEAGFGIEDVRRVEGDIMNAYYICSRT